MRGDVLLLLLVELEQRRIHHPEEVPARRVLRVAGAVLRDEAQLLPEMQPQVRQHRVDLRFLAELEQDDVAGLRPHRRVDCGAGIGRDRLRQRALRPVALLVHLGARQALGAHALGDLLQLVGLRARQSGARRDHHRLRDLPGRGLREARPHRHAGAAVLGEQPRQVHVLQAEAQVGLVVAVLAHRLVVGHARKRSGDLDSEHLAPERPHQLLDHGEHVVLRDEGHLQVDLGELGLPVEAQVLVPEALDDLEVPVEPGHHEELLEELRALRQRVELPRLQPRRHEEVARAAGRVLDQEGRLELEETALVEHAPGDRVRARAQQERALHRRPAQVQVAVVQPLLLRRVDPVLDEEGRRLAPVEDLRLRDVDLHLSGGELRVHVRAARDHLAAHADAVLEAQLVGQLLQLLAGVFLEDDLRQAGAVAQVDEHRSPVVATVVHPAEQDHLAAGLPGGQLAAGMGPLHVADEFGHVPVSSGVRCGAFGSTIRRPLRGVRAGGRAAAVGALASPLHLARAWDGSFSLRRRPVRCSLAPESSFENSNCSSTNFLGRALPPLLITFQRR